MGTDQRVYTNQRMGNVYQSHEHKPPLTQASYSERDGHRLDKTRMFAFATLHTKMINIDLKIIKPLENTTKLKNLLYTKK